MGLLDRKKKAASDTAKPSRADYGGAGDDARDPANEARRRARRRLVGAIALVLAAIVVLPMVLDSEPNVLPDDLPIQIPDRNSGFTPTAKAPAQAGGAVSPPDTADAPAPDSAKPGVNVEPPVAAPAQPVPSDPVQAPPGTAADEAAKAEAQARAEAAAKAEAAKAKADAARVDAERARALLEGKASRPPAETAARPESKGSFAVQIAAFSTEDRAADMRERLAAAGIKSAIERVKTGKGDVFRVRVGPFPSREAADAARDRVNSAGFSSSIVPL